MRLLLEEVSIGDSDLVYIGEGNANLVVGLKDRSLVLRFLKGEICEASVEDRLNSILFYFNHVIHPRLGDRFLSPLLIVRISRTDLEDLKSKIWKKRPEERREKDIHHPICFSMPDLTSPTTHFSYSTTGPTLSVEIKPKNGFLNPRNCPHPSLCNFCLKQFYKLKKGSINTISQYCPLDLFSGDEVRMAFALKALLDCPQNNLRMFGDGDQLHTSTTTNVQRCQEFVSGMFGSEENLIQMLITALLSDYQPDSYHCLSDKRMTRPANHAPDSDCDTKPCKFSTCGRRKVQAKISGKPSCKDEQETHPPHQSVLSKLLDLQSGSKLCDKEAEEVLYKLTRSGKSIEDIQGLLLEPSKAHVNDAKDVALLAKHVLYTTAKDVSVFVTFRRDESTDGVSSPRIRLNDDVFCFSIKIVDLDIKHVSKIPKYASQKDKWLNSLI